MARLSDGVKRGGTIASGMQEQGMFPTLAVQRLGWSDSWSPPEEHAHDWLAEALRAAERLGL